MYNPTQSEWKKDQVKKVMYQQLYTLTATVIILTIITILI